MSFSVIAIVLLCILGLVTVALLGLAAYFVVTQRNR